MELRTKVEIPKSPLHISHKSRIQMLGSCFIENIGKQLVDNKFNVDLNPFGVLYNPQSIAQAIRILIGNRKFTTEDIFQHKGLYHSFYHHSSFSDTDIDKCISKICNRTEESSDNLRQADVLIITFGTAYIFRHKELDMVVGNCHKLPASEFDRYRLTIDNIVEDWKMLIDQLREINPLLQIIFTVSPIRHLKDGAHDNQLSKLTLLMAIDELCNYDSGCHYFPSYEIMLDELRDYRFYNEDMVHPSPLAIRYIWERFSETYISDEAHPIIEEWNKIYLALNHRPLNDQSDEYKHFLRQTLLKLKAFDEKYPYICCSEELSRLETLL